MLAKYLWETGSLIIAVLGSIHLYYTFFTRKFHSKNESVVTQMEQSSPLLTQETTMWRAWIGFNASHSSGAMFIGIINIFLAETFFETLQTSHFYFLFNIVTLGFYLWLARRYWFRIPFTGILIAFACYTLSYILTQVG